MPHREYEYKATELVAPRLPYCGGTVRVMLYSEFRSCLPKFNMFDTVDGQKCVWP